MEIRRKISRGVRGTMGENRKKHWLVVKGSEMLRFDYKVKKLSQATRKYIGTAYSNQPQFGRM